MSGQTSAYELEIIPAIDLKAGRCVRLRQGKETESTEYSSDPVGTAMEWSRQGARRLHVVNLDGAFGRASRNIEVLREITSSVPALVQFGGGLRAMADIEQAFQAGAGKVVLGTVALENPEFLGEVLSLYGPPKVIVAIDALDGRVATRGWKEVSDVEATEFAHQLSGLGVREILFTDIAGDGMLSGPDLATLVRLADGSGMDVIASGGVSSVQDVVAIRELGRTRITGVIIGRALYEGKLRLGDALKEARGKAK